MALIRILVPVAGSIGPHDSPAVGAILEVPEPVAEAWADGVRAVRVDTPAEPEQAIAALPERRRGRRAAWRSANT